MSKVRTNVVIDKELVERAMETYGLASMRETIDFALRRLVSPHSPRDILDLEGAGWSGDLDEMRGHRHREP